MPIFLSLVLFIISFVGVWFGADLVINSIGKLAKTLRLPAFTLSFVVLGLLTSLPELAIGITAIKEEDPQIFVGNLIGAIIVLFLFVIPLLVLTGNRIKIPKDLTLTRLILVLVVVMLPTIFTIDKVVENWEGAVSIVSYILMVLSLSRKQNIRERLLSLFKKNHRVEIQDVIKIAFGVCLLIVSSNYIVDTTLLFANILNIAPFFVSLIIVSIGTNIPELSLVIKTAFNKKQEIALADFLGSASVNTLLFGVLTLLYPTAVNIPNHFMHRFIFMVVGLLSFFVFARSKNIITKREGVALLLLYVLFIIAELQLLI